VEDVMNIEYDIIQDKMFIAGPLNLDLHNKEASTTYGRKIDLTSSQFNMLYIMATNEAEILSFQTIVDEAYEGVAYEKSLAYKEINGLMDTIAKVGHGFMKIVQTLDGYSFTTKWGRDWQKVSETVIEKPKITEVKKTPTKAPQKNHFKRYRGVYAGMATAAVMGIALVWTAANRPEVFELQEPGVPMGYFQGGGDVIFPTLSDIAMDTANDIRLYNPSENSFWMAFKIVLASTGEVLFETDPLPPGGETTATISTSALKEGSNKAVINIRAYSFPGFILEETTSTDVNIKLSPASTEGGAP